MIAFNDMIADLLSNKKLKYLVFMTESYFLVPKNIRLKSKYYFVIKISNKQELQQIAFNHSSNIEFRDFTNFYRKCKAKPYSFLAIDCILVSDSCLDFSENHLKII